MKRILFILAATLAVLACGKSLAFGALPAAAPAPMTKEELAGLHRQTQGWKSYRIDFRVTFEAQVGGQKTIQKFGGRYEVSGAGFHISTPDVELFSDGQTKWEVNRTYREISIDNLSAGDRGILANPARFFDQMVPGIGIEILGIVPHTIPGADFRFDPTRYPGFETIDFR